MPGWTMTPGPSKWRERWLWLRFLINPHPHFSYRGVWLNGRTFRVEYLRRVQQMHVPLGEMSFPVPDDDAVRAARYRKRTGLDRPFAERAAAARARQERNKREQ